MPETTSTDAPQPIRTPPPACPDASQVNPLPLIDPRSGLVLITNSKCGGSSVKASFFEMLELPTSPLQALKLARRTSTSFAWAFHIGPGATRHREMIANGNVASFAGFYAHHVSRQYLTRALGSDYRKIAIVRHPYARCVSGYLDKFCGSEERKPWAQEVVDQAGTAGALSFRQFVTYLSTTDNAEVNRHWRRQTFVIDFYGPEVEFIRLEHLEADLEALDPPPGAGTGLQPEHRNANPFKAPKDSYHGDIAAPDLSNTTLMEMRGRGDATPSSDQFLTDDLRADLARVYARDFERLPYTPDR